MRTFHSWKTHHSVYSVFIKKHFKIQQENSIKNAIFTFGLSESVLKLLLSSFRLSYHCVRKEKGACFSESYICILPPHFVFTL